METEQRQAAPSTTASPERFAGESRIIGGITLAEHLARHRQHRLALGSGGCGANLRGADLGGADLGGANLRGAQGLPEVPVVTGLDAKIASLIDAGAGTLDMGDWHTCETTHCRAGWAIQLAGEPGKKLETAVGPAAAGALIYHASTGRVPDFYASDEDALADIRAQAAVQAEVP